jgi:hypothetical protein
VGWLGDELGENERVGAFEDLGVVSSLTLSFGDILGNLPEIGTW